MESEQVTAARRDDATGEQGGNDRAWQDLLVELHILAENGDGDAARTAQRWLSGDAQARRMWDEVEEDCQRLRHAP